ncbi:hypothetical protein [Epilithonimonas sp.]|uniref:hypothetical protein n=1 Tax=Epilithonimonas sp. TaxID=2894511 RepID=UPI0028A1C88A|nr:hypothetical protein [Epilithonimonas sp.]
MKKYFYLLILSFSLISCYTYKVATEADETSDSYVRAQNRSELDVKSNEKVAVNTVADRRTSVAKIPTRGSRNTKPEKEKKPKPTSIIEKLEVGKFFKIDVADRSYKIQVDKWESDTLMAHVIHKPKNILKFHKNQINQSTIAERRFSQPIADIITVAAYAGVGLGIWSLVK